MKYALWDFDGTLGYRDGGWGAALLEAVRRECADSDLAIADVRPYLQDGFPWHHPDRVRSANQAADEWWSELEPVFESAFIQAAGFSSYQARSIARSVRDVYVDLRYWHLFDDTLECLDTLRAGGWKHAIVSNHVPELPKIVSHLGLSPYVSAVYSSASLGVEKPHPKIFQRVLDDLRPNGDVWMIGDNPIADVAGAEAVGIKAILVRSDGSEVKRHAANLKQVPQWLGVPNRRVRRTDGGGRFR